MFSEIGNIKQMLVAAAGVAGGGQTVLMSVKMVSRSPFLLSFVHRFRQQDFKAFAAFPDVEVQGMVGYCPSLCEVKAACAPPLLPFSTRRYVGAFLHA